VGVICELEMWNLEFRNLGGKKGKKRMAQKRNGLRLSKMLSFTDCIKAQGASVNGGGGGAEGFSRVVFCNQLQRHTKPPYIYQSNYVSTTKYNLLSFFPKALYEQFRRVANLYFLLAAAISLTPATPYSPLSLIAPLTFVIGVSMAKEGIEDWHRFLQVNLFFFYFFYFLNKFLFVKKI